MARHLNILFSLLMVLSAQLVNCTDTRFGQVFKRGDNVGGPNLSQSPPSSFFPYYMLFCGYHTLQECQALMCATRCSMYSTLVNQRPTEPCSFPTPNQRRTTGPPNDVIPVEGTRQMEELRAILGPGTHMIVDRRGQIIGMEAPSAKSTQRYEPRLRINDPGDDGSISCST